jgi:hypothetical protein
LIVSKETEKDAKNVLIFREFDSVRCCKEHLKAIVKIKNQLSDRKIIETGFQFSDHVILEVARATSIPVRVPMRIRST